MRIDRSATGWPVAPAPTDLGNMSCSASSQRPRIAVGPNGTVHTAFYNNNGNGNWAYRAWNGSWGTQTTIGTGTVRQDNKIGRASCRERVEIAVVGGTSKQERI